MIAELLAERIDSGLLTGMDGRERIELVDTRCTKYECLSTGERQLLDIAALVHEVETAPVSHLDEATTRFVGTLLVQIGANFGRPA